MSAYIGIDLGTSGVKMLLTDGEGKILNETSRTYPVSRPAEGWSEQNPEDWWEAVKDGLRELACKKKLADSWHSCGGTDARSGCAGRKK